jgi:hypothetical protein
MSGLFQSCQETLERTYGCKAAYSHSVAVYNPHGVNTAWDGYVGVFDLTGHPTAVRAYAWSCLSSDGQNRTLCILHAGSVTGPEEAMKALLISETKGVFRDFDSR